MKPHFRIDFQLALTLSVLFNANAKAASSNPVIIERGPNHRVWESISERILPDGKIIPRRHNFTELATGMHYWKEGQWTEAREEIEIVNGHAIARQGQLQVIWAGNFRTPGGIDLQTPNGRFRSHILGLAYTDRATGRSVLVAEPQDSFGEVTGNQIIYRDALVGDSVRAHVRFTYKKSSFEQDILIVTALEPPSAWGLSDESSVLECWTEMLESPLPQRQRRLIAAETSPQQRQRMLEPDLVDEHLWFGAMDIGQGQAFSLDADDDQQIPISKVWENVGDRTFLIERANYQDIQLHLQRLPREAGLWTREQRMAAVKIPPAGTRMSARPFPAPPRKTARANGAIRMASLALPRRGLVLDYITMVNQTNQVFKADTTYYVSGDVQLTGTTILEGGCVVKYTNSSTTRLYIKGPLDCRARNYHPAIFTARDDNTVGEPIPGAASAPFTNYANRVLDFTANTNEIDLHHVHIRHGYRCLALAGARVTLSHSIIGNGVVAFYQQPSKFVARNVLVHDTHKVFDTASGTNRAEHLTLHKVGMFKSATGPVFLTNSLLISVTNNVSYTGQNIVANLSAAGIFQTGGAAGYYLSVGSTNRNAGTTNISPSLAAELKKKTTYPPVVIPNGYVSTNLTFSPQASRDTDLPDLGFHYDPIDFAVGGIYVTNCTITVHPATVVATFTTNATYSIGLANGARFLSEGTPAMVNRFVRYNTVQEQSNTNWAGGFRPSFLTWDNFAISPEIRFRFTDWSCLATDIQHLDTHYEVSGVPPLGLRDCAFHSGRFVGAYFPTTATNCLFERVASEWIAWATNSSFVRNSLFFGGSAYFFPLETNLMSVCDTVFDSCSIIQDWNFDNGWNAYTTNATRLIPNSVRDVLLAVTNLSYQTGPLGRYYLPTTSPLINTGSVTSAASIGLYHYVVTTNQVKEANSWLDIGLHHVAVKPDGQPVDSDGDGLPDYLEDKDGDGIKDSGETGWLSAATDADTDGDGVTDYLEVLLGRNPLVAGSISDFGGALNLRRYTPLQ